MKSYLTESPAETRECGREFAHGLKAGDVLALCGEMGAGKTCFVQGLAQGLGVNELVSSPTYLILHEYDGELPLYHMDLYRLKSPAEVLAFGFEEYLSGDGVLAIEWPDTAFSFLPESTCRISFECGADENKRIIRIDGLGC